MAELCDGVGTSYCSAGEMDPSPLPKIDEIFAKAERKCETSIQKRLTKGNACNHGQNIYPNHQHATTLVENAVFRDSTEGF